MLVPDVLRKQAAKAGDRVALKVDGFDSMTYRQWDERSNRLGRYLVDAGVAPGDRVALRLSNRHALDYLVGYFAIQKAGGVVVPINTRLSAREAAYIVDHAGAEIVLAEPDEAAAQKIVDACAKKPQVVMRSAAPRFVSWGHQEALFADEEFQVPRGDDDLADILYTSGTTGFPKGVASTHDNVSKMAGKAVQAFEGQTFLHAFPYYTFAGTHGMMMLALWGAMTAVAQVKFDAARYLELLSARKVGVTYLAPAMIQLVLDSPELPKKDYGELRLMLYGSAATPPEAVRRLAKAFPTTFQVNVYGLTEGGGATCSLPPQEALARPGSIGRPVPPTEVSIRNDDGAELPSGKVGEIWMRLPGKRRTYYKNEEASAQTWTADGWLKTGDVGHFDDDGYLYIDDRKKDMIIRGGHNVFPAEVEAAVLEHEAVAEVAVVGIPHKVLGEDVKAFVVLHDGRDVPAETMRAFCSERLADYKTPRQWEFLRELPPQRDGQGAPARAPGGRGRGRRRTWRQARLRLRSQKTAGRPFCSAGHSLCRVCPDGVRDFSTQCFADRCVSAHSEVLFLAPAGWYPGTAVAAPLLMLRFLGFVALAFSVGACSASAAAPPDDEHGSTGGAGGGGGISSGGQGGAGGAPTGGFGGNVGVGGSGAVGSLSDGGECTGVSQQAENSIAPVDIVWAIDNSCSMTFEAGEVQNHMNLFAQQILNQGLDVHVAAISEAGPPGFGFGGISNGICIPQPLGSGSCPNDSNMPVYMRVDHSVSSSSSLVDLLNYYPQYKAIFRKNSVKYFAVVTDDNSSMSAAEFIQGVGSLDPGWFNSWRFFGVFCTGSCGALGACAQTGSVYLDLTQQSATTPGDLCLGQSNFAGVFSALATTVTNNVQLACDWEIPPPPDGQQFDSSRVNVEHRPSNGGPKQPIYWVENEAACAGGDGWYYDNNDAPTRVFACPNTCNVIKNDLNGAIDILFGCYTLEQPK